MSVGSGGREGPRPPWIFIDGTDKVEGDLMVLIFGLVFPIDHPYPLEIFLPTPLIISCPA